ncbi:1,2-phenylacetyl-CoA epoxidase subunit PaaC [Alphaproteobacteria bacterium LSUCC0719]|jgi:ring-1,2-phenylacetyl-CoA epoxidase subunit PaaC
MADRDDLLALLLRIGDDHLILGHRLSEWCGHAPMLEEDLALPNMALDLIGTARMCYGYAAEIEGDGRSEDDYAFLRDGTAFRHMLMVERPNGDFAFTILRQFLFAAYMHPVWDGLTAAADQRLAEHAGKAVKEMAYHVRHGGEWVVRLGDGTEESADRMLAALADLGPYLGEMFERDETSDRLVAAGLLPDPAVVRAAFDSTVARTFAMAQLPPLDVTAGISGGRRGRHGEVLGHLLAEMQFMQRAYPGLTW